MTDKRALYEETLLAIHALCEGEDDEIALMSTIVCELHRRFDAFHWTGFYRVTAPGILKVGPYQGGHGCLTIPFERGVCGKAASDKCTQIVEDVNALPYHIACSSTTISEIVVPVLAASGEVCAVLDIDSDFAAQFDEIDREYLEKIASIVSGVH